MRSSWANSCWLRGLAPADVEAPQQRRQAHAPVRGVAAEHQEDQRILVRGRRPRPHFERAQVARAERLVGPAQVRDQVAQANEPPAHAADHVLAAGDVEDAVEARREPAVGQDQPAVGCVVERARHHRPEVVPRVPDVLGLGVEGDAERVAVSGEARTKRWGELREPALVLEQHPRRAERAGGQHERPRLDGSRARRSPGPRSPRATCRPPARAARCARRCGGGTPPRRGTRHARRR